MRYQTYHRLTYQYDTSVFLAPHTLRLCPRSDVTQKLSDFRIEIIPQPKLISENIDFDGNTTFKVVFSDQEVQRLTIEATSFIETYRTNPFNYLLESWAIQLPIDYPVSLANQLQPYWGGQFNQQVKTLDPIATQLAQELWQEVEGRTTAFLTALNQRIYTSCDYVFRETGAALPAGLTWINKSGSCRDYAVLFIEACRAVGLAARFVSGYQEGDLDSTERHLHAWAEVYLPGAGWRGYDPTQGLAVADRHIALLSMPSYQNTTPVSGSLQQIGFVQSQMQYWITITAL